MLQKMHERGQEIEEQDAKQKQELIDMEKERLGLQKMQWQRKLELMEEQNRLKKEEKRAIADRDISQAGAKRDGFCLYHAFCIACWRQSHGKKRCKIQRHCKSSFALREYITPAGVSLTAGIFGGAS